MKCVYCAKGIKASMTFCPHCGQRIEKQGAPGEVNHDEGDIRKHATVLFADVKESTALVEGLDPEEAKNILLPIVDAMKKAIYSYGGTIIQTAGDGVVAVFGAPLALEDHALRACLASLAIQDNVLHANRALKVRVGLHSGEVYLEMIGDKKNRQYDITGQTVNLAARMEQTAKPGTVQITQHTLDLVEEEVQASSLGVLKIKGFSQPIAVFELQAAIKKNKLLSEVKERPTFLPFRGREKEIDLLNQLVERTAQGSGNIVNIIASAGQGKSRLLYEFIYQGSQAGDFDVLITGGFSHTQHKPYFPLVHALQHWLGITPKETKEEVSKKIQAHLTHITVPHAEEALMVLLGFSPQSPDWDKLEFALKRKYQCEALMAIFFNAARVKPLVFIIEDAYWIDNETKTFLETLIAHFSAERVLLVLTSRSDESTRWLKKFQHTEIKLALLSQTDEAMLLDDLLGNHPSLKKIKNQLSQHCAGNPFFLEEMVKSLIHDEVLIGPAKNYQLSERGSTRKLQLSESIIAILQTQLDSLLLFDRNMLRTASVIGERFTYKMLTKIMDTENDHHIQQGLRRLTAHQLIYETQLYPEPEFAFKHALIQEVTYNSLLKSVRRATHSKVLSVLEAMPLREQDLQLQAYHAYQGEIWDKVFVYCYQAAHHMFFSLSANQSAAILYEKALVAAEHLKRTKEVVEKSLYINMYLITIYRRLCRLQDEGRHIQAAGSLLLLPENHDQQALRALFYSAKGSYHLSLGDTQKAMQWYQASCQVNVSREDNMMRAVSLSSSAYIYLFVGQYAALYRKANEALSFFPNLSYRHVLFPLPMGHFTQWMKCWVEAYTGDYDPKAYFAEKIQSLLSAADIHRPSLDAFYVLMSLGWLNFYQGLFEQAIEYLSRAYTYAAELEVLQYSPSIAAALGCAYLRLNQIEQGNKFTEEARTMFHRQTSYTKMLALDLITEALLLKKDYLAAKTFSQQAMQIADRCELAGIKTTLLRLSAEIDLHLPRPPYASIKQRLEESMERGVKLGMVSNSGHCQWILAKMYQQMGDTTAKLSAEEAAYQCYEELGMKMEAIL